MKKLLSQIAVLAIGMSLLIACGDDDDVRDAGKDGGSNTDGGNAGKNGGVDASTNGSGGAAAVSVECGPTTCRGSAMTAGFLDACCADRTTGTCGQAIVGGACMRPIPSDPQCSGVNAFGIVMLASCCTADGKCGLNGAALGGGCVSLEEVAMSPLGGLPVSFPKPKACTPPDGGIIKEPDSGLGDDAGSEDAGR